MKLKKLNKSFTVFNHDHAKWVAKFRTEKAFMAAILRLSESFGAGSPFTGYRHLDEGNPWLFRQATTESLTRKGAYHGIYISTDEQATFLAMTYSEDD